MLRIKVAEVIQLWSRYKYQAMMWCSGMFTTNISHLRGYPILWNNNVVSFLTFINFSAFSFDKIGGKNPRYLARARLQGLDTQA